MRDYLTNVAVMFILGAAVCTAVVVIFSIAIRNAENKHLYKSGLCLFLGLLMTLGRSLMKTYPGNVNANTVAAVDMVLWILMMILFTCGIVAFVSPVNEGTSRSGGDREC